LRDGSLDKLTPVRFATTAAEFTMTRGPFPKPLCKIHQNKIHQTPVHFAATAAKFTMTHGPGET